MKAYPASTAAVPTVAGTTYVISNIAEGDTEQTRTGLRINAHTVSLGALFKMTATCSVRVVFFYDKINNGSIPATNDILDSADVIAPLNYLNTVVQKRFVIIEDYVEHFSLNGTLSATRRVVHPLNFKIHFKGASNATSDLATNNLFALVITDTPTAGQVNLYSQVRFTDE